MVPGAVIDLSLRGFDLDGPRAHVQQQVQPSIQQLHRKEVHLVVLLALCISSVLGLTVGEKYQPVGFRGAEVEGDGSHAFGVPFRQGQVGVGGLKVDGVEGGDIFALENNVTLELHLGVHNASKTGQFQADIIVLVHHLGKKYRVWRFLIYMQQIRDMHASAKMTILSRVLQSFHFFRLFTMCHHSGSFSSVIMVEKYLFISE